MIMRWHRGVRGLFGWKRGFCVMNSYNFLRFGVKSHSMYPLVRKAAQTYNTFTVELIIGV